MKPWRSPNGIRSNSTTEPVRNQHTILQQMIQAMLSWRTQSSTRKCPKKGTPSLVCSHSLREARGAGVTGDRASPSTSPDFHIKMSKSIAVFPDLAIVPVRSSAKEATRPILELDNLWPTHHDAMRPINA